MWGTPLRAQQDGEVAHDSSSSPMVTQFSTGSTDWQQHFRLSVRMFLCSPLRLNQKLSVCKACAPPQGYGPSPQSARNRQRGSQSEISQEGILQDRATIGKVVSLVKVFLISVSSAPKRRTSPISSHGPTGWEWWSQLICILSLTNCRREQETQWPIGDKAGVLPWSQTQGLLGPKALWLGTNAIMIS